MVIYIVGLWFFYIVHANARGLISKMQSIQSVLDEIEADIIAITETKLNKDRNINIPGYKWIGRPRLNKEGGGVGVYVQARNYSKYSNPQNWRRQFRDNIDKNLSTKEKRIVYWSVLW